MNAFKLRGSVLGPNAETREWILLGPEDACASQNLLHIQAIWGDFKPPSEQVAPQANCMRIPGWETSIHSLCSCSGDPKHFAAKFGSLCTIASVITTGWCAQGRVHVVREALPVGREFELRFKELTGFNSKEEIAQRGNSFPCRRFAQYLPSVIEFLCFCEKVQINTFTNQETNKKELLCQNIHSYLWLQENRAPRLSLLCVLFVREIIVEIGLLPVKCRSFCGENLSHPCIPFYGN